MRGRELATVTSIYYENGGVYIDAKLPERNNEYKYIPVQKPFRGMIQLPEEGDLVVIGKLTDRKRTVEAVLTAQEVMQPPDPHPRELKPGEFTIRLDEKTELTFSKSGGGWNVDIGSSENINIQSQGNINLEAGGELSVTADGDINLTSKGDIDMNASGSVNIQGVSFMSHTHDYEEDGNTKTTDPPNS